MKIKVIIIFIYLIGACRATDNIHITPKSELFIRQPDIDSVYDVFDSLLNYSNSIYMANKILSINQKNVFFGTEKWQAGTWGRGYYTKDVEYYPSEYYAAKYANWLENQRSCNPLIRETCRRIIGYVHEFKNRGHADLEQIKSALIYVINSQNQDGGFTWWFQRKNKYDIIGMPNSSQNIYDTSIACRALCDGYVFLNSSIINERSMNMKIINAIDRATNYLIKHPDLYVEYPNGKFLVVWSMVGAYKITGNKIYLKTAANVAINSQIIQRKDGSWVTPDNSEPYHDANIFYHGITIRGLSELYSVIEDEETRENVRNSIINSINHIIDYNGARMSRFDYSWPGAYKSDHEVLKSIGVERGMTLLGGLILTKSNVNLSQNDRLQIDHLINYTINGIVYIGKNSTYYQHADCDIAIHNLGLYLDYAGYSQF